MLNSNERIKAFFVFWDKWIPALILSAVLFWLLAGAAYVFQDIAPWPYNQIDWKLAIVGNFYLGILIASISFPFLWPKSRYRLIWILYLLANGALLTWQLLSYRSSFSYILFGYPAYWVDAVVLLGTSLMVLLNQIKGSRQ